VEQETKIGLSLGLGFMVDFWWFLRVNTQ